MWKAIDGLTYEVSDEGLVKSLAREVKGGNGAVRHQPDTVLKGSDNGMGYTRVHMKGSPRYYDFVHQLVAKAFLPNPEGHKSVDHINGIKDDNRVENLKWVSHGDNIRRHHDKFFRIAKSFSFCYGHRVWSQSLDATYSIDSCHACRHLHGHEGLMRVHLKGETLKDGMITDFKHLNWFKLLLDDVLDHKFIIDINDPLFGTIVGMDVKLNQVDYKGCKFEVVDLTEFPELEREFYESFVIVDFVPTSENLSAWFVDVIQEHMAPLGVLVEQIELYETPKSQAVTIVKGS